MTLTSGTTYYFWITADIASGATAGHTIIVNGLTSTSVSSATSAVSGTTAAAGTQTLSSPALAISNTGLAQIGAQTLTIPSTKNAIADAVLTPSLGNSAVTSISFVTSGTSTYAAADIATGGFQLWYSTTATFPGSATQLGTGVSSATRRDDHVQRHAAGDADIGHNILFLDNSRYRFRRYSRPYHHRERPDDLQHYDFYQFYDNRLFHCRGHPDDWRHARHQQHGPRTDRGTDTWHTIDKERDCGCHDRSSRDKRGDREHIICDIGHKHVRRCRHSHRWVQALVQHHCELPGHCHPIGRRRELGDTGETITFSGSPLVTLTSGTTYYFWITADIASGATAGHTVIVNGLTSTSVSSATSAVSGTSTAAGTQTLSSPALAISNTGLAQIGAQSLLIPSTKNAIADAVLTPSLGNSAVTSISFVTSGTSTYAAADIATGGFKLWYSATATFPGTATQLGAGVSSATGPGETITFSGAPLATLTSGTPYYFWITADIASGATPGHTIIVNGLTTSSVATSTSSTITGSSSAGGTQTLAVPTLTISNTGLAQIGAQSLVTGSTKNAIADGVVAATVANSAITSISFVTSGTSTYAAADIATGGFKLWYSTTASFPGTATQLGAGVSSATGAGETITFSGSPLVTLTSGSTYYFWITVDVAAGATGGHTIIVNGLTNTSITTSTSSAITGSTTAAGTQTISSQKNWIGAGAGGTSTDFNLASNWSPAFAPAAGDVLIMNITSATSAYVVQPATGSTMINFASLTITYSAAPATAANWTFNVPAAYTMASSGNVTITNTGGNKPLTLGFGVAGAFTVGGNLTVTNSGSVANVTNVSTSGTLTVTGTTTANSSNTSNNGSVRMLVATGGTVTYTGAVTIDAGNSTTAVSTAAVYMGGSASGSTGTFKFKGDLNLGQWASTLFYQTVNFVFDATTTETINDNTYQNFFGMGNMQVGLANTPTVTLVSGIYSFGYINNSGVSYGVEVYTNLTVSMGATLVLTASESLDNYDYNAINGVTNGTLTVNGVLKLAGTYDADVLGSNIPTGYTTNTLTAGTVEYEATAATGAQTVTNNVNGGGTTITYGNLTIGDVTLTPATSATANGALTIAGSVLINPSSTFLGSTYAHTVAGNWTNNGAYTQSTGTVTFNGGAAETIGGTTSTSFYKLTIANTSGGVSTSIATTVTNTLTLTSGILTTTSGTLSVTNAVNTAIGGGSATSFINGPVKWSLPATSATTFTVPIGSETTYLPLALNNTTSSAATVATIQAFNGTGFPNGADATLTSVSSTEYWKLTTTLALTGGTVSIAKASLGGASAVAYSPNGDVSTPYTSWGGSTATVSSYTGIVSGTTFTAATGTTWYFACATLPACTTPGIPTGLSALSSTATTISATIGAPGTAPTGYLVFFSTSAAAPSPANGTTYTQGTTYFTSYIAGYVGTSNVFTSSTLVSNTNYYMFIFSYNNTACAGPVYSAVGGLGSSEYTCVGAPTSLTYSAVTTTAATVSWTAPPGTIGTYTLYVNPTTAGTSGVPSSWANTYSGITGTSYNLTGLTVGTTYYFAVVANNPANGSTCGTASAFSSTANFTTVDATVATDYFRAKQTGNWSSASTWQSSHNDMDWLTTATQAPNYQATSVAIGNNAFQTTGAVVVTVDIASTSGPTSVSGFEVNTSSYAAELILAANLSVNGDLRINGPTTYVTTAGTVDSVHVGTGTTLTISGSIHFGATYVSAGVYRVARLDIASGGVVNVAGDVIEDNYIGGDQIQFTGAGTAGKLNVHGNWNFPDEPNQGFGTPSVSGSGTVSFSGTGSQNINQYASVITFYNLTDSNVNAPLQVHGNIGVSNSLLMALTNTVLMPDPAVVLNSTTTQGTVTGVGTLHVNRTTGTPDYVDQYKFSTNTLSSMTVDYCGTGNQNVNSTATIVSSYGSILLDSGGTKSLQGLLGANSTTNGVNNDIRIRSTSVFSNTGNYNITLGGNWVDSTGSSSGSYTPGTSTVYFNKGGSQSIYGTATGQTFSSIATVASGTALTVGGSTATLNLNGSMTMSNSTTMAAGTATNIYVGSNWTDGNTGSAAGGFTPGTGTVTFTGATGQAINGTALGETFYNLSTATSGTGLAASGSIATLYVNNNVTLGGSTAFNVGTALSIYVGGSWLNSGAFTSGLGKVTFNASSSSATQNIQSGGSSFYTLVNSTAGTVQLIVGPLATTNTFTNTSGIFDANALAHTVTGLATINAGTYYARSQTQTFNGGLTISGGTFTGSTGAVAATNVTMSSGALIAPSGLFSVTGNWAQSGGTFTPGTYTVTFALASGTQTISTGTGTAVANSAFNNINHTGAGLLQILVGGAAVTTNGTFTNASGAGNFDANGQAHTVGTQAVLTGGTYLAKTGTQTFNGGGLTINGGTLTGSTGSVATTNLTLSSGALTAPSGPFSVSGNWAYNGGTFTPGTYTVTFNGASASVAQIIGGALTTPFYSLTMNNTGAGATTIDPSNAGISKSVTTLLTLTKGLLTTDAADLLILGTGATSSLGTPTVGGSYYSSASYVNGPLQKVGSTAFTFPVGKSNGYEPITIGAMSDGSTQTYTAEYIRQSAETMGLWAWARHNWCASAAATTGGWTSTLLPHMWRLMWQTHQATTRWGQG